MSEFIVQKMHQISKPLCFNIKLVLLIYTIMRHKNKKMSKFYYGYNILTVDLFTIYDPMRIQIFMSTMLVY